MANIVVLDASALPDDSASYMLYHHRLPAQLQE